MLTLNNDLLKTGQKIRKMSFKLSWFCAFFITPSDPSVKLNCLHIKSAFAEKLDRASTNWFQSCFLQNSRETPIPFILFIHCTKSGIRNCATMPCTLQKLTHLSSDFDSCLCWAAFFCTSIKYAPRHWALANSSSYI